MFLCKLSNLHKSGQNILMSFHLPMTQIQARAMLCRVCFVRLPCFFADFFRADRRWCICCLLRYNKSPLIWLLSHMRFPWVRSLAVTQQGPLLGPPKAAGWTLTQAGVASEAQRPPPRACSCWQNPVARGRRTEALGSHRVLSEAAHHMAICFSSGASRGLSLTLDPLLRTHPANNLPFD